MASRLEPSAVMLNLLLAVDSKWCWRKKYLAVCAVLWGPLCLSIPAPLRQRRWGSPAAHHSKRRAEQREQDEQRKQQAGAPGAGDLWLRPLSARVLHDGWVVSVVSNLCFVIKPQSFCLSICLLVCAFILWFFMSVTQSSVAVVIPVLGK